MVVGDVDGGDAELSQQALEVDAILLAQGLIEIGEGLVDEKDGGVAGDAAPECDALFLATGEGGGLAVEQVGELHAHELAGAREARAGLGGEGGRLLAEEIIGEDVGAGGDVGIEGIVLKDHADATLAGRHLCHIHVVVAHVTGVGRQQPGDQLQQGRLAATAGSEHDHGVAVGDAQGDVADVERSFTRLGEGLADVAQIDPCHN